MSKRNDEQLLLDMLRAIESAQAWTSGLTLERFSESQVRSDNAVSCILYIGECAYLVSKGLKVGTPEVQWEMLVRECYINPRDLDDIADATWVGIIHDRLPLLKKQLMKMFERGLAQGG